jgi:hypothetical protein
MKLTNENVADVLREKLQQGEVNFVFKKVDGSRRAAVGTTNPDLIPLDLLGSQKTPEQSLEEQRLQGIVRYFDTEKQSWRSCKSNYIINVDGEEVSDE